jgi:secreted trypsin-like serine protease
MKLSFPISAFTLLAASSDAVNWESTLNTNVGSRIVGGTDAEFNEFPSMAIPDYTHGGAVANSNMCGATLIHDDILLTAAHCQFDVFGNPIWEGWNVFIGGIQLSGADAVDNISVESVHPHPDYDPTTFENDIMLIKLAQPSVAQLTALHQHQLTVF